MAGENGATQSGVQERDSGHIDESQDRPLTPREQALADIKKTRLVALADEIVEGADGDESRRPTFSTDDEDERLAAANDQAEEERRAAAAKSKDQPAPKDEPLGDAAGPVVFAGDPSKTLVKVKIDGVEYERPLDKVLADVQKAGAADKRLQEATELLAAARAAKPADTAVDKPGDNPGNNDEQPSADTAKLSKEYSAALFEGDEDKAAKILQQTIDAGVQAALSRLPNGGPGRIEATQDIVDQITQRVTDKTLNETALARSQADYPQLYADPIIQAIAHDKIVARRQEGQTFPEALAAVEAEFAKSMNWTPKSSERQPSDSQPNRERVVRREAKRGIDTLPTASARRAGGPADDTPPPLDERDRASRGIDQLRRGRPEQSMVG